MSSSRSRLPGSLPARLALLAVPALALLAGVAACSSGTSGSGSGTASDSHTQSQYEQVVNHVLPSVVQISTSNSTGSGVVYDSKGDIVTNAHVVDGATTVMVREPTGTNEVAATVVGTFPPDDLAVVRVQSNTSGFKPAVWTDSNDVKVGQIVLAMGNPLGLTDSVTQGIVSATGRTVGEGSGSNALITAAIQTSAAINPGNSGGALVNLNDQVIGIPTLAARLPDGGGAAPGIGFAIPSDTVRNIAGQLIKDGKVTKSDRASLGITAEDAETTSGQSAGVAVVSVNPGSAAASAGVQPGDIIVGLNNQQTATLQHLQTAVAQYPPGTKVTIHYTRDGSATVRSGTGTLGTLSG
ncbi:MAG TPA: trypsin-like peptidase domain-containing protein [Streptosporangiaceae bacterium]|nr:trypsin-like peptidase domain-containing protein [Streptosporangiaceae bacterium]